jgi:hypothetical protein
MNSHSGYFLVLCNHALGRRLRLFVRHSSQKKWSAFRQRETLSGVDHLVTSVSSEIHCLECCPFYLLKALKVVTCEAIRILAAF